MAGEQIYIGEMLKSVNAKLDDVMTSMASQVAKMDDQIAALNTVNTTVGQSIVSGNLVASNNNAKIMNAVQKTATNTPVEVGRIKIFGNGKIRVSASIKAQSVNYWAYLRYSINGAAQVALGQIKQTAFNTVQADINVKYLDEIVFYLVDEVSYETATLEAQTLKAMYDLTNLVVDGYVALG